MKWFRPKRERYIEVLIDKSAQSLLAVGRISEALDVALYKLHILREAEVSIGELSAIADFDLPLNSSPYHSSALKDAAAQLSRMYFEGGYSPNVYWDYTSKPYPHLTFSTSSLQKPKWITVTRDIPKGVHYALKCEIVTVYEPVTPLFEPTRSQIRDPVAHFNSGWPIEALLHAARHNNTAGQLRLARVILEILYGALSLRFPEGFFGCLGREEFIVALARGGYFPPEAPQGVATCANWQRWVLQAVYKHLKALPARETVQSLLADTMRAIAHDYAQNGALNANKDDDTHLDEAFDWFERLRAIDPEFAKEQELEFRSSLTFWKENVPDSEIERLAVRMAPASSPQIAPYRALCESPAESRLLDALVERANLIPADGDRTLVGLIKLEVQVHLENFRVDFVVDDNLIIEVDGRAYHSDSDRFENDRYRDQALLLAGYRTLRFPAKQIFLNAAAAADIVLKSAAVADRRYTTGRIFDRWLEDAQ